MREFGINMSGRGLRVFNASRNDKPNIGEYGTATDNHISTNNYHFRHFLYKIFFKNSLFLYKNKCRLL